jgi:hypothetical protein
MGGRAPVQKCSLKGCYKPSPQRPDAQYNSAFPRASDIAGLGSQTVPVWASERATRMGNRPENRLISVKNTLI